MKEPVVQTYSDSDYAELIREAIKNLSKLTNDATKTGLIIQFKSLEMIGKPEWIGYKDAVTIIRKY